MAGKKYLLPLTVFVTVFVTDCSFLSVSSGPIRPSVRSRLVRLFYISVSSRPVPSVRPVGRSVRPSRHIPSRHVTHVTPRLSRPVVPSVANPGIVMLGTFSRPFLIQCKIKSKAIQVHLHIPCVNGFADFFAVAVVEGAQHSAPAEQPSDSASLQNVATGAPPAADGGELWSGCRSRASCRPAARHYHRAPGH